MQLFFCLFFILVSKLTFSTNPSHHRLLDVWLPSHTWGCSTTCFVYVDSDGATTRVSQLLMTLSSRLVENRTPRWQNHKAIPRLCLQKMLLLQLLLQVDIKMNSLINIINNLSTTTTKLLCDKWYWTEINHSNNLHSPISNIRYFTSNIFTLFLRQLDIS